jgi:tetratricopeptide (TPR) repeat protein
MNYKLSLWRFLLAVSLLVAGGPLACRKQAAPEGFLESGRKFFEAGQFEKAKNDYLRVLEKEPANATAIKQIGIIWAEQGAPLMAVPYLLQTVKTDPGDVSVRKKLASAFLSAGDLKSASREASAALDADPADGEALLLLCDSSKSGEDWEALRQRMQKFPVRNSVAVHLATVPFYLMKKDFLSARDAVDKARQIDPKSVSAHAVSAKISKLENDRFGIEESLKAAAEASPARGAAPLEYARYLMQKGEEAKALAVISAVTSAAPDYLPAWQLAAGIDLAAKRYDAGLAVLGKIFAVDPENYLARLLQADILVAKGDPRAAIASLASLAANERYSRTPSFLQTIARAHVQNGEPGKAIPPLEQAVSHYPDYVPVRIDLANLHLAGGRPDEVIRILEGLLEKSDNAKENGIPVKVPYLLALAYQKKGRLPQAMGLMKQVVGKSPPSAELQVYYARMLSQAGNHDGAREALELALKLEPENLTLLGYLVDLEVGRKRFDAASQRIQAALDRKPESAELSFFQGKVFFAREMWEQAEAALQKSTSLDPKAAGPAQLLVQTILRSGNGAAVLERLEGVLKSQPSNIQALQSAARLHQEQKDFEKAREKYQKLVELMPDNLAAMNNLAVLFAGPLKNLEEASKWATKARSLLPGPDSAAAPAERHQAASVKDTCSYVSFLRAQYSEAYTLGREAAMEFPEHPEVQYHFGMAAAAMGRIAEARSALSIASGAADFSEREDAAKWLELLKTGGQMSVSAIEALLQAQPKDVILQSLLAEALERSGDYARAVGEFGKILEANPLNISAALRQAGIYARHLGEKEKALAIARERRPQAEDDPFLAGMLGGVFYEAGAYKEARQVLLAVAQDLANKPEELRYLGLATYCEGDVAGARREMEKALESLKAVPGQPLIPAVTTFMELTRPLPESAPLPDALVQLARQTLETDRENVPALMILAESQLRGEDPGKGDATLNIILGKYPDFAPALKKLAAHAAVTRKDIERGLDLGKKARRVLATDAELSRTLGILSFYKQEYPSSILYFEEAARSQESVMDANALCLQGLAYVQTGTTDKARTALKEAVRVGLTGELAAQAADALKKLDAK